MPGFDGTGPQGAGPMTGGGRGFCNPAANIYGRRQGFGRGFGRGFGPGIWYGRARGQYQPFYGPAYPEGPADELSSLKAEADYLKGTIDAINKRIDELEKGTSK